MEHKCLDLFQVCIAKYIMYDIGVPSMLITDKPVWVEFVFLFDGFDASFILPFQ